MFIYTWVFCLGSNSYSVLRAKMLQYLRNRRHIHKTFNATKDMQREQTVTLAPHHKLLAFWQDSILFRKCCLGVGGSLNL